MKGIWTVLGNVQLEQAFYRADHEQVSQTKQMIVMEDPFVHQLSSVPEEKDMLKPTKQCLTQWQP